MSTVFVKETGAGQLQVEKKFEELVATATGAESLYIKAKESMLEYFASANLSEREKAETLGKLVGDMAISMTGKLMDTALKIETENRDAPYMLAKIVADVETSLTGKVKIEKDIELVDASVRKVDQDIENSKLDNKVKQAQILSKTGYSVSTLNTLELSGAPSALSLDQAGINGAVVDKYIKSAASFRKDGFVSVVYDAAGVSGLSEGDALYKGLSEAQKDVAVRQKQGFDDNMLQHAANSSANLMGLMISDGSANLLSATTIDGVIPNTYLDALSLLATQTAPA